MRFRRFLSELERRRVYRVAVTYVVAAFAVLEAADLVLPVLTDSEGIFRVLVILALAGFPVALVLAWTFDVRRDPGAPPAAGDDDTQAAPGAGPPRPTGEAGAPAREGGAPTGEAAAAQGPRSRAGMRRTLLATFVLGGLGIVAWWLGRELPAGQKSPGSSTVAVLPLAVASGDTALERISRDLTVTLGSALERVGELSTVEPLTVLALAREDDGPLTLERARSLAAELDAGTFVHGALVRSGEAIRADLAVYETDGPELLGRDAVTGSRIDGLTDSAAVAVLSHLWDDVRLAPSPGALTTGSLDALEAYLEGERAIAEGRWRDAPASFERAIAADSTFWLAYWRLMYSLQYHGVPVDSLVRARVQANRGALPERDRLLIEAREGRVEDRLRQLRNVTTRYPSYWPAWWDLSEALVHHGPFVGRELDEAVLALQRTLELNPRFVPAWSHLFWTARIRRDAREMERIIQELSGEGYDEASLRQAGINSLALYRAQHALVEAGPEVPDQVISLGTAELSGYRGPIEPQRVASALLRDGFPRAQAELSRAILQEGTAPPPMERAQHYILAYARATLEEWEPALESARTYAAIADEEADRLLPYRIAALGIVAGGVEGGAAEEERPADERVSSPGGEPALTSELAWLDGLVAFGRGDGAGLEEARRALRESGGEWTSHLEGSLDALDTALRGDSLAAGRALAALERESADRSAHYGYGSHHPLVVGVHRVVAARWLLAGGDTATARSLLRWHDAVLPGTLFPMLLAGEVLATPALRMRRELEEAVGREVAAARLRARLADRR